MAESSLENVADLIARPPEEYVPEPRYVSKYREQVRRAAKRGKSAHKTLGVPNVNLNPPTQFLKKNSNRLAKRPEVHHTHYRRPGYQHKLPDWQPIKANDGERRVSIDFAKRNINEAKNLRPLVARKYYVDDRRGTVHPLEKSGLFPLYRNKKNYEQDSGSDSLAHDDNEGNATRGKAKDKNVKEKARNSSLPRSTQQGKSHSQTERAKFKKSGSKLQKNSAEENIRKSSDNSDKEKYGESGKSSVPQQPRCRYVTEDERAELLYGMKKKWDEMMEEFQCLPFMTDTLPKTKRKAQMEKDLLKLEKDIQVIERHPYIYVYSDSDDEGEEKQEKTKKIFKK